MLPLLVVSHCRYHHQIHLIQLSAIQFSPILFNKDDLIPVLTFPNSTHSHTHTHFDYLARMTFWRNEDKLNRVMLFFESIWFVFTSSCRPTRMIMQNIYHFHIVIFSIFNSLLRLALIFCVRITFQYHGRWW